MEEKIYFSKLRRLVVFFLMFYLSVGFVSAQSGNCQAYTLTQGGWGAPNVDNPHVSYLYANFDAAFPQGITLGCPSGNTLKLTSPTAITDFLPSGSTASALDGSYVDPGGAYTNVLAAQLVSVMLAVGFDNYDAGFSVSNSTLGNFVFVSGPFQGKTVNQFLSLANNFMGGCGVSSYSAMDFNTAATAINENYDEGNRDLGYLKCCTLQIHLSYDAIKCHGGTTVVHVSAEGGSSATTGTGDFVVGAGTHTFTIVDGDCSSTQTITIGQPEQLVVSAEFTPILCNGGTSTVTVSASGGTAPYSGTGTFPVSAGTYTYTVTDANGCVASKEIVVTEPSKLEIQVTSTPILCNGGSSTVTVSASGGTTPYNGTGTYTVSAGTHSYTVTDANGCVASKEIVVTEPSKLEIQVTSTPILCNGGQSTVTVSASGGTAPYTGTGTFTVSAGTHSYTVTDANGCVASKEIVVTEPSKLEIQVTSTPILCNGGSSTVTVSASGGTAPYSGTGTFTVSAGTHSYTVTDANGCVASKEIVVTEPSLLKVELSAPPILCISETVVVTATASGGTAPYSYLWSNGSTESTATLGVGSYSVTVTDANGCKATANGQIIPPSCGGFTTVTQGGWGAKAAGNNWGKYRDTKFAGAFPTGLTIGSGSRFLKLTSAKAVDDFLPSGSTPRALNAGTMTNPGGSYSNVLAGQVVALTLNVRFDLYDPNFSASNSNLGDLVVISGTFANWTVNQILAEANKILGGQSSPYSASEINAIVDAINNNYDGGKMNNGLLTCPCPTSPAAKGENNGQAVEPQTIVPETNNAMVLYPNPSNGEFNLKFDAKSGTQVIVQLYDATGKLIGDFSNKVMRSGNNASLNVNNPNLASGLYLVKVKTSQQEKTIKLMIKK